MESPGMRFRRQPGGYGLPIEWLRGFKKYALQMGSGDEAFPRCTYVQVIKLSATIESCVPAVVKYYRRIGSVVLRRQIFVVEHIGIRLRISQT